MVFVKDPNSKNKFGAQPISTVTFRLPAIHKETIHAVIKEYVDNFSEDNVQKIKTVEDDIKQIISVYLDIKDYIEKEGSITESKYRDILYDHVKEEIKEKLYLSPSQRIRREFYLIKSLFNDLISKFPIVRKPPIRTLTEEKREEEKVNKPNQFIPKEPDMDAKDYEELIRSFTNPILFNKKLNKKIRRLLR